jgi:hypothetical protein
MILAYKLVRKMSDGKLASLFINRKSRLPLNKWLVAGSYRTKGFAYRPGWHCTLKPIAPHLSTEGRVWVKVEITGLTYYDRPESQGGTWILAKKMRIIEEGV